MLYTTARRGIIRFIEGRFAEARSDLRKVVPWSRERGDRRGLGVMTLNLAKCSHYLGESAEACHEELSDAASEANDEAR